MPWKISTDVPSVASAIALTTLALVPVASAGAVPSQKPEAASATYSDGLKNQLNGIGESFGLAVWISPELRDIGLGSEAIHKALRRQFKDRGVQVVDTPVMPAITMSFSSRPLEKTKRGEVYLIGIELQVKEIASSIQRKTNKNILATVWGRFTFGVYQKNSDDKPILEATRNLIDVFTADYKNANR